MSKIEVDAVIAQAKKELQEELFRAAVDKYKMKLKTKKSFLDKVFPYKLVLIKKGDR